MSSSPVLDSESIENLRALSPDDGDVFLREILGIFLEDTPARIADLHRSKASGDAATFMRAAHSVKGSSSNVGAMQLRDVAGRLEHAAKSEGLTTLDPEVAALESAFATVAAELRKLL